MLNPKQSKYGCYIYPNILSARKNVLSDSDKILLSKIILLSRNDNFYCYAWNYHLAAELGKTNQQITRGITRLVNKGYIGRSLIMGEDRQVKQRQLTLTPKTLSKIDDTPTIKNDSTPTIENDKNNLNKVNYKNEKEVTGTSGRSRVSFEEYKNIFGINECADEVLTYYLDEFKTFRNLSHPDLMSPQWQTIIDAINGFTDEMALETKDWCVIIDAHFSTKYRKNCDFNLLHFISYQILENRYNEKILREK
jgi:hypothetical protein